MKEELLKHDVSPEKPETPSRVWTVCGLDFLKPAPDQYPWKQDARECQHCVKRRS